MCLDYSFITNNAVSVILSGAVLGIFTMSYRWIRKVDKALDSSVVSLARISETLTDHNARLETVEGVVALRPKQRYSRGSKSKR